MMPTPVYKANKIERIVYDRIYFIFICFSNKLYNFFVEITLKYFSIFLISWHGCMTSLKRCSIMGYLFPPN